MGSMLYLLDALLNKAEAVAIELVPVIEVGCVVEVETGSRAFFRSSSG